MTIALAVLLTLGVLFFTLAVREKDLPEPEPVSPFRHLDEKKARIYENLRDLQFEFRVGKLSEDDYQRTKQDLQKELAVVLSDIDKLKQELGVPAPAPRVAKAKPAQQVCPHCAAKFDKAMKFCGECGKAW